MTRKYYTVYLNKEDSIITFGTAKEYAKQMNRSIDCFYSTVSKSLRKKQNKYTIIVELLEEK